MQHFFVRKETLPKETPRADFRSLFTCNRSFPKIFNSGFQPSNTKSGLPAECEVLLRLCKAQKAKHAGTFHAGKQEIF